jgi:pimeloyl-ACP methyl ester carboxylesterase
MSEGAGLSGLRVMVLNGWASSPHAWDLCRFMQNGDLKPKLFSYTEQLQGEPEREFASHDGKFILVGWSMGGSSALRLACVNPEKIAGLVLIAATPRMMESRQEGWKGMSPRRLSALRRGLELTKGQGFGETVPGRPNPYMMDSSDNLDAGLKYLTDTDIRMELEKNAAAGSFNFPVYIFQSRHDGIVCLENADFLKTVFTDSMVELIEGTEHALSVVIPEKIDDAVMHLEKEAGFRYNTANFFERNEQK